MKLPGLGNAVERKDLKTQDYLWPLGLVSQGLRRRHQVNLFPLQKKKEKKNVPLQKCLPEAAVNI